MHVIGIDVCSDRIVVCLLAERPADPRDRYLNGDFQTYSATGDRGTLPFRDLLATVVELGECHAILEPTGVKYSRLWAERLADCGAIVHWVGHKQLRKYRENLELPDKDDFADALALACYYFDRQGSDRAFVQTRDPVVAELRTLVLRLEHIARCKSPVICNLRQDLAYELPECQNKSVDSSPCFWGWLAGRREAKRYDRIAAESIGLGVSDRTRWAAGRLVDLLEEEDRIHGHLRSLLYSDTRFTPYLEVFARYCFGDRTSALLLSQIYPLENYLRNGKPETVVRKGKVSGKPTTRRLSLRRFTKALGVAPVREESGKSKSKRKGGSSLCRRALWRWMFCVIEVRSRQPKTDRVAQVRAIFEGAERFEQVRYAGLSPSELRGVQRKLRRAHTLRKVAEMVFYDLIAAIAG